MTERWPLVLERGVAGQAHEGHDRSGDLAVFAASEALETAVLRAAWALHDVRREGRGRARAIW